MPLKPAPIGFRPGRPGPFRPGPFFGHRGGFGQRSFEQSQFSFIAPLIFPYADYPAFSSEDQQAEEPAAPAPVQATPDNSLANEVANLAYEVEALRQKQESSAQSAPSEPPPEAEPQTGVQERLAPAIFVYRDGQQFEARNYAVLGGTLWVYEDEITRKIPLAKLDLERTRKLNDTRGIDFSPELP